MASCRNEGMEVNYLTTREGKLKSENGYQGFFWNPATGTIENAYTRWTVYTPNATPETTGITAVPNAGPWLMFPGTPGSHIMITPPRGGGQ